MTMIRLEEIEDFCERQVVKIKMIRATKWKNERKNENSGTAAAQTARL